MPGNAIKMLVADDAVVVRDLFDRAAAQAHIPIELISTANGRDCMARLGEGDIGLAFIDIHMPGMSGLDALWGARHKGIKTFVTLMSGTPSDEIFEIAQQLKAYEFLEKPFAVADVLEIIETYERIATPMRALLVDDSTTVRKIIEKVLAASIFNIETEHAADGATAIARCAEGGIDIVFLDCNMPGLDGLATLNQLLARNPQMTVVMISGERTEEREQGALDHGAVAFLHKPFYAADIDALLHRLYGLRSPNLVSKGPDITGFEVQVQGRVVTVKHTLSDNGFQYIWYRDAPHLRSTRIRQSPTAVPPSNEMRAEAEIAAIRELKRADLVYEMSIPKHGWARDMPHVVPLPEPGAPPAAVAPPRYALSPALHEDAAPAPMV